MTDDQTIKLSRIFNRCLLDLEQIGNFDLRSGDREQAMQVLMDTMESAMSVKENSMESLDVEIGRLEDRVVEAAVAHRRAYSEAENLWRYDGEDPPDWPQRMSKAHTLTEDAVKNLLSATDVLIAARKKAEQQNFPLSC